MTLTQLAYLVALDDHRHFGRAAEQCYVSQPTLSTQIQKLEEELGAQLFDRSRQPVLPTDLGRRVIAQARIVLRESARIRDIVAEDESEVAGELRLGVLPTLAPYLLPLVTHRFAAAFPRVAVTILELPTQRLLEMLATDQLDAALIATEENDAGLHVRTLFNERFVAYVSPGHRLADAEMIAVTDLDLADLWLLSDGHCFRDQVLDVCGQSDALRGIQRHTHFESGNIETLRKMVEWSGGMTLLPYLATLYLSDEQRARYVKPFADPAPSRDVRIAYARPFLKRRLIDAYVDTLLQALPDLGAGTTENAPAASE